MLLHFLIVIILFTSEKTCQKNCFVTILNVIMLKLLIILTLNKQKDYIQLYLKDNELN